MEATIHMHRRLYSLDYLFPDSPFFIGVYFQLPATVNNQRFLLEVLPQNVYNIDSLCFIMKYMCKSKGNL